LRSDILGKKEEEMTKRQIEPFTEFAELGYGIPRLFHVQNCKTAHVHWGDGSLWHYAEFSAALDKEGMENALMDAWTRHKAQISRRTELAHGSGVHGALVYGPTALAMEIRNIVQDHFTRALNIVATRIREHRTYMDELKADQTSRRDDLTDLLRELAGMVPDGWGEVCIEAADLIKRGGKHD
jgi:hypothetical protein